MKKSDINPMPEYFGRYINLNADTTLDEALQQSLAAAEAFPLEKWKTLGSQVYAPGKWTVKDILQHIIDTERIFCYRALRFARNDSTALPGYDEDAYAASAGAEVRTLEELVDELKQLRVSSIQLFRSFTDEMLRRSGTTFSGTITVAAIGFTISGHQYHHINVLEQRYYPLLEP